MRIAILGMPQSGKKTLFTLLTGRAVPHGRKEGESVEGKAPVRDARVDEISRLVRPAKTTYAETEFALCPDITESGRRYWVDAARRSDLLCMVVRSFASASVYHPSGSVDAERDRGLLATEVLLADLELVENRLDRIAKEKRGGLTPEQAAEEKALGRCREALQSERMLGPDGLDPHEAHAIRSLGLLTLKPLLWVYNADEGDEAKRPGGGLVVACKLEEEIAAIANADERRSLAQAMGMSEPGVDRLNAAAYDALGLMSFYTMGEDEVRAWTIRKGTPAPGAAGKIHTDMERGFIRVQIVRYEDLMALKSEKAVKDHGKLLLKGRDYVIQDGDICSFLFNT